MTLARQLETEDLALRLRADGVRLKYILGRTGLTLNRYYAVIAAARAAGRVVTPALVARPSVPRVFDAPPVRAIQAAVARAFAVAPHHLVGPSRRRAHNEARQAAMLLARTLRGDSYPHIGRAIGGWHHTSVIHGCRAATARMAADPIYAACVEAARVDVLTRHAARRPRPRAIRPGGV